MKSLYENTAAALGIALCACIYIIIFVFVVAIAVVTITAPIWIFGGICWVILALLKSFGVI